MARCGAADGVKMFLAGGGLPDLHIELIKGGAAGGGGAGRQCNAHISTISLNLGQQCADCAEVHAAALQNPHNNV